MMLYDRECLLAYGFKIKKHPPGMATTLDKKLSHQGTFCCISDSGMPRMGLREDHKRDLAEIVVGRFGQNFLRPNRGQNEGNDDVAEHLGRFFVQM